MLNPFRRWRLESARLALADLKHHRKKWGWSYKPSRCAEYDRRRARLERRIQRLESTTSEGGPK